MFAHADISRGTVFNAHGIGVLTSFIFAVYHFASATCSSRKIDHIEESNSQILVFEANLMTDEQYTFPYIPASIGQMAYAMPLNLAVWSHAVNKNPLC